MAAGHFKERATGELREVEAMFDSMRRAVPGGAVWEQEEIVD